MLVDSGYMLVTIAVVALVTWSLRAIPFIVFGNRILPQTINFLSHGLPPAIMTILVVYCLAGTGLDSFAYGMAEMTALFAVVGLQKFKKNMYVSIIAGTICYMLLIRLLP